MSLLFRIPDTASRILVTAFLFTLVACGDPSAPEATTVAESTMAAPPSGYTLVEQVEAEGDEIIIPYSKYELDNGLLSLFMKTCLIRWSMWMLPTM